MYSLPLPRNLEDLEDQLKQRHTHSEKMEHLDWVDHEYGIKLKDIKGNPFADIGFSEEASQAIIASWREIQSAIPNVRKHLNQEYEGNAKGFEFNEWRKGRKSPYPLVWNEDKFREYERMIHEAGLLEDWVRWLLRGLSSSINDPDIDDSLSFTSSVLSQARIDAENKGEDGQGLLWECMSVSVSFRRFLEEQRDNLPRHFKDEIHEQVEAIPEDAVLKIRVNMGFSKLMSIFSDLEKQGFIKEGTILELYNHFTESLLKEITPSSATPIQWLPAKYKLVYLLRRLKGSSSIEATDKQLEPHFSVQGQPFKIQRYSIKDTDDNSVVEQILKSHL